MPKRSNLVRKKRDRWFSLSDRFTARKCAAEDAGLVVEAERWDGSRDDLETGWQNSGPRGRNQLYRYIGAPERSVDLQQFLDNPAYRRHLISLDILATPVSLWLYIKARNDRVAKFELWRPGGKRLSALPGTIAILAKGFPASGKGAHPAFQKAMVARRKEIGFLNIAIENCHVEGLAATQPESELSQDLPFDPIYRPWQLGHVCLLRDIATNDIEITAEQRSQISEVIKFLRNQQS